MLRPQSPATGEARARPFLGLACLMLTGAALGGLIELQPAAEGWSARLDRYEGIAGPSRRAVVGAPTDGVLAGFLVREGERVVEGQTVARMDDRIQRAIVEGAMFRASSDSAVRTAELDLAEAQRELGRMKSAMERGASNESEIDRAQTGVERAAVALDQAREVRRIAELDAQVEAQRLDRLAIEAPFDGVVVRTIAEVGESLQRAAEVALVIKLDPLEAEVYLPAEAWRVLRPGASYRLQAAAPVDAEVTGTLRLIDPLIESASRKVRCVFDVANPGGAMPAGFAVHMASLTEVAGPPDPAQRPGGAAGDR